LEQGLTALLFFIAQRFRAKWMPVRVKKTRQEKKHRKNQHGINQSDPAKL
jgi:hypothetical protein